MGDGGGYLKSYRKQFREPESGGCPWWNEPRRFSRWEAWWYLIQIARWTSCTECRNGHIINLERGETPPLSIRYLAKAWGWGKNSVSRFLGQAKEIDRIKVSQETQLGDTYIIVNYDTYQSSRDSGGTAAGQRRDSGGTKKKKVKKGNEEEIDCSEQASEQQAVLDFEGICNGDPKSWYLSPKKLSEWENLYPFMDVLGECKRARQWIRDNPKRRKTARGMTRFLGSWLDRAQNSGNYLKRNGEVQDGNSSESNKPSASFLAEIATTATAGAVGRGEITEDEADKALEVIRESRESGDTDRLNRLIKRIRERSES